MMVGALFASFRTGLLTLGAFPIRGSLPHGLPLAKLATDGDRSVKSPRMKSPVAS